MIISSKRLAGLFLTGLFVILFIHQITRPVQGDDSLFFDTAVPQNRQWPDEALQAGFVEINWDALQGGAAEKLKLNLFDEQAVTAVHDRTDKSGQINGYVWVGHVVDYPQSEVTLSVVGAVMAGTVTLSASERYEIQVVDAPVHLIQQLKPSMEHNSMVDDAVLVPETAEPFNLPPNETDSCSDDGAQLDVMVLYTSAARETQGGTAAIEAWINERVSQMNSANGASQVNFTPNLVHVAEVDYQASNSIYTDLSRLRTTDDGYLDEIHVWRDAAAADLVALVIDQGSNDACGVAYVMNSPSEGFASSAFSVTALDYPGPSYCDNTTLSHEMGHNLGSQHDHANSNNSGAFPYSHGFQSLNKTFRTIMAYNCPGGCPKINYWSNPDITYLGEPTGVDYAVNPALAADNSRSLNELRMISANFRKACALEPTPTPTAPPPNGCVNGSPAWGNESFPNQGDRFSIEFDATPLNNGLSLVGVSNGAGSQFADFAAMVRFGEDGRLRARDGDQYHDDVVLFYTVGTAYHFSLEVDLLSHTYSVFVDTPSQQNIKLAHNYAFRSEQNSVSALNNWGLWSETEPLQVCNVSVTTLSASTPTPTPTNTPLPPTNTPTPSATNTPTNTPLPPTATPTPVVTTTVTATPQVPPPIIVEEKTYMAFIVSN